MIIFFIHRFNDVDHFTPEIYKIVSSTDQSVMVLCLNPYYNIFNDFRLIFLKEEYNVHIDYIYNAYKPSILYKILGFFMQTSQKESFKKNKLVIFFCRRLIILLFHRLMGSFKSVYQIVMDCYDEKWVNGFMKNHEPLVLIFDYAATNRLYGVKKLIKEGGKKKIPIIYLPHGIPLFLKHSSDYDRAKQDLMEIMENQCDSMVFYHRWWRDECIEYGLNPDRSVTLGIPRHCKEWQNILHRIIPPDITLGKKGKEKLKVVYMDSGPDRYHEHKINAQKTIDMISKLDYVSFIYKPHTRRNHVNLDVPSNVEIIKNINSVNLIKWADVVIGMHSSIMIEVLIQGKVYISPTYFRSRKMIYEEYGACCMVQSITELEQMLEKLKNEPLFRPYSKDNVERFFQDVIYNGEKGKDILGDYKEYILDIAKGKKNENK